MDNKQKLKFEDDLYKKAWQCYRAINNDLRQEMLAHIHKNGAMCVMEIYRKMGLTQSDASLHLGILRREGYVKTERVRRSVYYSVNYERVREVHRITGRLLGEG